MKGTIVQQYGPIYGEAVNGTVFGRPNGSVYVPPSNTITISCATGTKIYKTDPNRCAICVNVTPDLILKAEVQDLSSNVVFHVYEDEALTTEYGNGRSLAAGVFNDTIGWVTSVSDPTDIPVTDQKYYIRAQLVNNGVAVATSNVLEVVGR